MRTDPLVVDADNWEPRIRDALSSSVSETVAHTFVDAFSSASHPVIFKCADGRHWVVKAQFAGRGVASDAALAVVAAGLGAPTPDTGRVSVDAALIAAEPELQNVTAAGPMSPGVWHGSLWIDGVHSSGDRRDDSVRPIPANAERYGRLALLFAWCGAGDRQFVYDDDPPHLVHVVDMGHALPNANGWTGAALDGHKASATLPGDLWVASGFDKAKARSALGTVVDPVALISAAAARPLDHWGAITMADRVSLAHYLSRQFGALKETINAL